MPCLPGPARYGLTPEQLQEVDGQLKQLMAAAGTDPRGGSSGGGAALQVRHVYLLWPCALALCVAGCW